MPLDLVFATQLDEHDHGLGKLEGYTSDDLDIFDQRPTEINDVRCRRRQWSRFEPEHLIHAMMLHMNFSNRARNQIPVSTTFRSATSVTNPSGPAREGSRTSVLAPFT